MEYPQLGKTLNEFIVEVVLKKIILSHRQRTTKKFANSCDIFLMKFSLSLDEG